MRPLFVAALFVSSSMFMGISGCPVGDDDDSPTPHPCSIPPDGYLMAGAWGGEHWLWETGKDGYIYLETDCAHGTSTTPVLTEGGWFKFEAKMVPEGGPVQYPPQEPQTYPATVWGQVCNDMIEFSIEANGSSSAGVVVYGKEPMLFKCL